MAYTKYSLTPADNNAAPPDGAPEGMLPSAVNDTMRDMMAQIRDVGDGIRGGTYTMTAPVITGGSVTGATGSFSTLAATGNVSFDGGSFVFNETGADKDARFEGDTDANLLFLDASTDRIGIGTSSPFSILDVASAAASPVLSLTATGAYRYQLITDRSTSTFRIRDQSAGSIDRFLINSSGNVGIGTTSPASTSGRNITIGSVEPVLVLNASSNRSYSIASGGNFSFTPSSLVFYDNTASAERMRIDSSGGLILIGSTAQKATGTTWSNPSDIRLKDNIEDYAKGLPELMQVKVKTWEYNGKGGTIAGTKGLGVVADEIKEILPDTVDNYKAKLNADDAEDSDIKKFDATEITWLMLKSIQELKATVDEQAARIATLEAK
jgi:hypothetical protein